MTIVAKMYVASVVVTGDCNNTEAVRTHVNLNCVYSPDPTTENHTFWKASPNGTLRISFPPGFDIPYWFNAGQMFKIYHRQDPEGQWRLLRNSIEDGRMNIQLHLASATDWHKHISAMEDMSIDNKDVFPAYADHDARYKVLFVPVTKEGADLAEGFEV